MDHPRQRPVELAEIRIGILSGGASHHRACALVAVLPPLCPELRLLGAFCLLLVIELVVGERPAGERQPLEPNLQSLDFGSNPINISPQQPDPLVDLQAQPLLGRLLCDDQLAQMLDPSITPRDLDIQLDAL